MPVDEASAARLLRLAVGHQISQALHAAATLEIADLLADGPRTSDELAEATGSDPQALYRLLRALASVGVFLEREGRLFELTELGAPLRRDAPDSVADWAILMGRAYYREAWSALVDSIRTGEPAFELVHGTNVWDYRAQRPEESAVFDRAMASRSRRDIAALVAEYDFSRFRTIVDVGGGNGALLAAVLDRNAHLHGILFDQPHVVEGVDLGDRADVVGGSFFDGVPEGGDAYFLKSIIHDWDDEAAATILRAVRQRDATLLILERLLGPPNETPEAKLSDLNMMVATGGRERTEEEFAALFEAAGFRLVATTPLTSGTHVIEGAPL